MTALGPTADLRILQSTHDTDADMDREIARQRMQNLTGYDAFVDLALELGGSDIAGIFDFLFSETIAGGRTSQLAGRLLIEIDPEPTRTCEALLSEVAHSKWDVSTKEVPFFFISWFGKRGLLEGYQRFIEEADLNAEQKQRVGTIIYWTAGSAAQLIRSYHDWPWREADDLN